MDDTMEKSNSNDRSTENSGSTGLEDSSQPEDFYQQRYKDSPSYMSDTCTCGRMEQFAKEEEMTTINLHKHDFIVCPVSLDDQRGQTSALRSAVPTVNAGTSDRLNVMNCYNTLQPGLPFNSNSNQDTVTSVRSRCVSISRRTYNTTDFNQQFNKIEDTNDGATNLFKRIVKSTPFVKTQDPEKQQQQQEKKTTGRRNQHQQQRINGNSIDRQNDLSISRRSSNSSNVSQMSPIGITPDDEGDIDGLDPFDDKKGNKRWKRYFKLSSQNYFTK